MPDNIMTGVARRMGDEEAGEAGEEAGRGEEQDCAKVLSKSWSLLVTSTAVAIVSGTNFRGGSGGGRLLVVVEEMEEIDESDKGDGRGEGGISVVKDKGVTEE